MTETPDEDPAKQAFIAEYYDTTKDARAAADLELACSLVASATKVAVDCGCGAGRGIAFLRKRGFRVHAFDVEYEAIRRCRSRFAGDDQVVLQQASFESFSYPKASLISANSSLFFCPPSRFDEVWDKISEALESSGVFVGNFLGPNDSMNDPGRRGRDVFWEILALTEEELRTRLTGFEIVEWREFDDVGVNHLGLEKHWHTFSVVARKRNLTRR